MNKITQTLLKVNHIEKMAEYDSPIHRLNPLLKIISAFALMICILTCSSYQLIQLLIYVIVLMIITKMAHVPIKAILHRSLLGLPLSLCLGLSNLILMKDQVLFYGMIVTTGVLSFISILLKTGLCLSVVFLLIATTRFDVIASELVHIKIPSFFVLQLVMTYRYIFLLVEEASTMSKAYLLKNPHHSAIEMKDMGPFIGSLLTRSFQKSEDVYHAMSCRGFHIKTTYQNYQVFTVDQYFLLLMILGCLFLIKVVCP